MIELVKAAALLAFWLPVCAGAGIYLGTVFFLLAYNRMSEAC